MRVNLNFWIARDVDFGTVLPSSLVCVNLKFEGGVDHGRMRVLEFG